MVTRFATLSGVIVALLAVAGCGSHRSVLDAGVSRDKPGTNGKPTVIRISSDQAMRTGRIVFAEWRRALQAGARAAPRRRFDNLPPSELKRRLAVLASAHDFRVVRVAFLHPVQLAPIVIVRTTHYEQLAHATPSILHQIDPRRDTNDDRTGWRYEGFFFEAQDEHGVPFLTVENWWRGPHGGGGDWARSDPLFPFPHG
jgi:hypothetical protein